MIDFRKLGEFCARHGCAKKYLRNVEDNGRFPYGQMPHEFPIDGAFSFGESPEGFEYWDKINDLWMQELNE